VEKNAEHQKAYFYLLRYMREEMGFAGLTFLSEARMEANWKRHAEFQADELESYLEKSGIAEFMAECTKEAKDKIGEQPTGKMPADAGKRRQNK
jgi:hypothetical protein